MTTYKIESPPNYQTLKQQRLRQILEDYFPPPPKVNRLFAFAPPRYVSTAQYQPDYDDTFDPQTTFEVRISAKLYTATIFICFAAFFFFPVPKPNGSFGWMDMAIMIGCLLVAVYSTLKLFDKNVYLSIDEKGLDFQHHNLFIPWENIIATHFYIDDEGEDDIYKLVTDYVDTESGTCKTEKFNLKAYDKSLGEIALAINYYQALHQQNHNSKNKQNHDQYEPNQQSN